MGSLPQTKSKGKLVGLLQVEEGRHSRSTAKLMTTTSLTSDFPLPCGNRRCGDRRKQKHRAQLEEESKAFEMHSIAIPCKAPMLRLAKSHAGHANGALVSMSDSAEQAMT